MTMHNDSTFWEMFRAEVDLHMAALNEGLLILERDPGQSSRYEALMRAAHSIKGAAKVMGLTAVVQIAHVIEDCFVAARENRLTLNSSLVDVLLEGVDLLGNIAEIQAGQPDNATSARISDVVQRIQNATHALPAHSLPITGVNPAESCTPAPCVEFRAGANFNSDWVQAHHARVASLLQSSPIEIQFDFTKVETLDPIGLAFLTSCGRRANTIASVVRLCGVSPRLVQLMRATGVDRNCTILASGT